MRFKAISDLPGRGVPENSRRNAPIRAKANPLGLQALLLVMPVIARVTSADTSLRIDDAMPGYITAFRQGSQRPTNGPCPAWVFQQRCHPPVTGHFPRRNEPYQGINTLVEVHAACLSLT